MSRLRASTRPVDLKRTIRALIAWNDGDKLALDAVLTEARADPVGVPGLLFDLLEFGTHVAREADPHLRAHLREALLFHEQDQQRGDT